ncbi:22186_t:CDS:2 [Dentiscutata erythropus]|uniref:22186_t:CDS:1 n=1 Tax=Dentiscutata erythropus TaxID=1348616 RepID=A0A9N9HEV5_9GLOM|nr:22186_t:CDS:2 [Dentiscutata erythropus]
MAPQQHRTKSYVFLQKRAKANEIERSQLIEELELMHGLTNIASVIIRRGIGLRQRGTHEKALMIFDKAVELFPTDAFALNHLKPIGPEYSFL